MSVSTWLPIEYSTLMLKIRLQNKIHLSTSMPKGKYSSFQRGVIIILQCNNSDHTNSRLHCLSYIEIYKHKYLELTFKKSFPSLELLSITSGWYNFDNFKYAFFISF